MKSLSKFLLLILIFHNLYSLEICIDDEKSQNTYFIKEEEHISIISEEFNSLYLITPVKYSYSNIDDENDINIQEILYESSQIDFNNNQIELTDTSLISLGTYYIAWGKVPSSILSFEPLHTQAQIIQIVVRADDNFIGYLMEMINTPFIYTPMRNANGLNQVENRIGSDCVSYITYGLRRNGLNIPYVSPQKIGQFLNSSKPGLYYPVKYQEDTYIYKNENNEIYELSDDAISKGIIISFREQISALYKDQGIIGVLDSDDLLIQSWFDGPLIVKFTNNGFWGYPISIYEL